MPNILRRFLGLKTEKPKGILLGFLMFLIIPLSLVFPANQTKASANNSVDWSFSSGTDYTYDSGSVSFVNQRADLIPTSIELDWSRTWTELGFSTAQWRMATDQSGDVVVKGHAGTDPESLYVAKLNASMQKVWEYTDSPGTQYDYYDYGRDFVDSNGNVITGGTLKDINTGQWYWYIIKLNSSGQKVWSSILIMPGITSTAGYQTVTGGGRPYSIQYGANAFGEDSSGNVYAIGLTGISDNHLTYNDHLRVVKYDSGGNAIWDRSTEQEMIYGIEPDDTNTPKRQISGGGAWDGKVDENGNVYTTGPGTLLPWAGRGDDWVTAKIDTDGNLLWARAWSSSGNVMDRPEGLALDHQGNVLVGGFAAGGTRPITVMYDNDGNQIWARNAYNTDGTLTSAGNGSIKAVALDYMGDLIEYGQDNSVAGNGILAWYDNQANRKYFVSDITFATGYGTGWNVATTDGYIYLTTSTASVDSTTERLVRYKYTYPSPAQAVINLTGPNQAVAYSRLDSFSDETTGDGQIKYQVSNDGTNWYFWNGSIWTEGSDDVNQSNLSSEINSHLANFNDQVGAGTFYFRVYMVAGSPVGLRSVSLIHDTPTPTLVPAATILPETGADYHFWFSVELRKFWRIITTAIDEAL